MTFRERAPIIMELLNEQGKVSVLQLRERFSVSEVTIRKDLAELERRNMLLRTFGGAVLAVQGSVRLEADVKDAQARAAIGSATAGCVEAGDFVFLGPGLTCVEVAKNLKAIKRLTVVTMNVSAAMELVDIPETKVILAAGDFTRRSGTYYVTGTRVIENTNALHFDKVLFTVDGISSACGFSVLDDITAQIFQPLIDHATMVYICAASTKFGKNALSGLRVPQSTTTIVTDANLSDAFRTHLADAGLRLVCAP